MILRLASTSALRATADRSLAQDRSRFRSVLAGLMTVVFVAFAGDARVLACPVCFGAEETTMISGTKLGVLFMLGITLAVQGAFVGFFVYLRKRARRMAELELDSEWAELQRASRT